MDFFLRASPCQITPWVASVGLLSLPSRDRTNPAQFVQMFIQLQFPVKLSGRGKPTHIQSITSTGRFESANVQTNSFSVQDYFWSWRKSYKKAD